MILALSGNTWTQIIVAVSIFAPLAIAIALAVAVLRGKRNDPDEQRMHRAQEEYRARQRAESDKSRRS